MPDFQRIAKRFQNGKAILEDVVRTYISVSHIPDIITALETLGREKVPGSREWEVVDEALVTLIEEKYLIQLRVSRGCGPLQWSPSRCNADATA